MKTNEQKAKEVVDAICRDLQKQAQAQAYWAWVRANCLTIKPVQE